MIVRAERGIALPVLSRRCLLIERLKQASGLVVTMPDSGSRGPGLSPGWGHYVVFLGKTLYSHSASVSKAGELKTLNY